MHDFFDLPITTKRGSLCVPMLFLSSMDINGGADFFQAVTKVLLGKRLQFMPVLSKLQS